MYSLAEAEKNEELREEILREIVLRCLKNYWRLNAGLAGLNLANPDVKRQVQQLAWRDFGLPEAVFAAFDLKSISGEELDARCSPMRPICKNLYVLMLNVAYQMVEKAVGSVSVAESRDAVKFYAETLRNYASATLLQNYGVACLELIRKLDSALLSNTDEYSQVLRDADDALSTAVAVLEAMGRTENTAFCETLMNWAAVARFQRDFVEMERRVRRATSSPHCSALIRGNGAFFLARYALDSGDNAKLQEQKQELIRLAGDDRNVAAIYDCGVVHFWLNELDDSVPFFDRAVKHPNTKAGALYMLGIVHLRQGKLELAMDECVNCVAFDPSFQKADLIYAKAALAVRQPNPEIRLDALKELVGKLQTVAKSSSYGGDVYFLLGKCETIEFCSFLTRFSRFQAFGSCTI